MEETSLKSRLRSSPSRSTTNNSNNSKSLEKRKKEKEENGATTTTTTTTPPTTTTTTALLLKQHDAKVLRAAAAIPPHILYKLFLFMFLLLVMPLASYFLSYSLIFTNPSIFTASSARARQAPVYSAIVAILVANGVVFTYVWIAFTEGNTINDDTSSRSVKEETKKKE